MQQLYVTSEVVRNIIMLQCLYLAKVYRDLLNYKLSYAKNRDKEAGVKSQLSQVDEETEDIVEFKIGIIGWGQVGTMILTKLLEVIPYFKGVSIYVSTRQPHLLKEFKQEFDIEVDFDNEKIAKKWDLIFLCWLPFQADIVLREIRTIITERNFDASKNKALNKPVIVSTLAAIGIPKLKILCTEETVMFRTLVNVAQVSQLIENSQSKKRLQIANEEYNNNNEIEKSQNLSESDDQEKKDKVGKLQNDTSKEENSLNEPQNLKFIGNEPYFMISQASESFIKNLDDLFNLFDWFQTTFYSGEAQVAMEDQKQEIDEDKAVYEESILITVLGEGYMDFIDSSSGEWVNEKEILVHFSKLFHDLVESLLRSNKNN